MATYGNRQGAGAFYFLDIEGDWRNRMRHGIISEILAIRPCCARWASQTKQEDDREILERMAKAWVNVALADDDVAREALFEPKRRFHSWQEPQPVADG
jgi:hypothetical protein